MKRINDNNGSALITVLAVLFILLTIFFAVFSFAINRTGIINKDINKERASYLADAGFNRFLSIANSDNLNWEDLDGFKYSDEIAKSEGFEIESELKGEYLLVTSHAFVKSSKVTKKAYIGYYPRSDLNAAIINHSPYYPVVVAGRTSINGTAIVGPESMVDGSIEGEAYINDYLVNGSIEIRADSSLPEINSNVINSYIDNIKDRLLSPTHYYSGSYVFRELELTDENEVIKVENNIEINSLNFNPGLNEILIYSGGDILIKNETTLSGIIEIVSGESIVIENSYLKNVILMAEDSIVFKRGSVFQGQAICNNLIFVSDSARIRYPSLIYAYTQQIDDFNKIVFGPGSKSDCVAVVENRLDKHQDIDIKLILDTSAVASGYLYSGEYTELSGILYGISETQNYWYYKEPTTYINWLRDAYINRNRLSFAPVLPVSYENTNGYAVFSIIE